jgi:uncharacterized protein (DUF433 family)
MKVEIIKDAFTNPSERCIKVSEKGSFTTVSIPYTSVELKQIRDAIDEYLKLKQGNQ